MDREPLLRSYRGSVRVAGRPRGTRISEQTNRKPLPPLRRGQGHPQNILALEGLATAPCPYTWHERHRKNEGRMSRRFLGRSRPGRGRGEGPTGPALNPLKEISVRLPPSPRLLTGIDMTGPFGNYCTRRGKKQHKATVREEDLSRLGRAFRLT
jgi:hypothetical protein